MTVYASILNTRSTDYRQRAGLPKENTPKHFRKYIRESGRCTMPQGLSRRKKQNVMNKWLI